MTKCSIKSLYVFDIDDTLFRTSARARIVNTKGQVKYLSSEELKDYEFSADEKICFAEFRDAKKFAEDISKSLNLLVGEIMFKKFRNMAIFLDETSDHIRIKVYFQSANDEVADHLENIFRSWPSLLALADGLNPELDEVMKHLKFSVIREKKSVGMTALLSHAFFETKVNEEIEKKKKAKEGSK